MLLQQYFTERRVTAAPLPFIGKTFSPRNFLKTTSFVTITEQLGAVCATDAAHLQITAASNDKDVFFNWNKYRFHSMRSWVLLGGRHGLSLQTTYYVGSQRVISEYVSNVNVAALFKPPAVLLSWWIHQHKLFACNLSLWTYCHLKHQGQPGPLSELNDPLPSKLCAYILSRNSEVLASLRRMPSCTITYFWNTATDVIPRWSSILSFASILLLSYLPLG